jgi:DNA polymerase I-like protein with 3'-5' exonuclease and polymerase domains
MFCTLRQPGGLGTKIEWNEPADYIESMFGFRRYFTLENRITNALFELAQTPPPAWKAMNFRVTRRDREQTGMGATQSALYGAAFALQASNERAAKNHEIQSSGAQITKKVQRDIWDLQPSGIGPWQVILMNIHDEVLSVTNPALVSKVKEVVDNSVESFRPKVPLIKMDWKAGLTNWGEK